MKENLKDDVLQRTHASLRKHYYIYRSKDLDSTQPIEISVSRLILFIEQMELGKHFQIDEFIQFIKDNYTLYYAYKIPQDRIIEGDIPDCKMFYMEDIEDE